MRAGARVVVLLLLLTACERAAARDSLAGTSASAVSAGTVPAAAQAVDASRRTAITEAVAKVSPSVVTVQTEIVDSVPVDFFEQFFGGRSGERVSAGLGSGFIVRSDGVIVTNAHVVAGATKVSVMMRDGTTYAAKVLGQDETNDLAVVKIDAKDLPTAPLGDSDHLIIGEWAIAIGNPFGFVLGNSEPSVTTGVISATGRNLIAPGEGGGVYVDMIQTDASINPGNSGGPLVDAAGEVIGVNSSIYTPSGGSVGLGFAIPINRAKRVAEDLIEHGAVRRPWIGELLRAVNATNDPRAAINSGVILRSVVPGSPAERAGLQPGDQIESANGRALRNQFDWEAVRLTLRVGETVPLVIKRGGRRFTVNVTVADRPEVSAPKVTVLKEIELTSLTPTLRAERSIRSERGALVTNVSSRVRDEIGLEQGDVIVQINRTTVSSAADVARAFDYYRGRARILMVFERGGVMYTTDFVIQ
jgi:serine protease Do